MCKIQPLKIEVPAQGWKQFLSARKEMLDAYDKARTQSKAHKVETYHGKVAEGIFRKWLSNFLPKRYGVTSGYIISQGIPDNQKAPHFDVIIYDQSESPILWVEDNPDSSKQGRSLAIPAEYVKGVIEVKSAFKAATVKEAIRHLYELKALLQSVDEPNERYKIYLPKEFFCEIVFFELRKVDEKDKAALDYMNEKFLRGFQGGLILRGEGHTKELSGIIKLIKTNTVIEPPKKEINMLSSWPMSDKFKVVDDFFLNSILLWDEYNFATFSFDIIALLNDTYDAGRLSSFHGFGTTELAEPKGKKIKKSLLNR